MEEIQRKSILVRVSARLELARVRVIGSQLSFIFNYRSLSEFGMPVNTVNQSAAFVFMRILLPEMPFNYFAPPQNRMG